MTSEDTAGITVVGSGSASGAPDVVRLVLAAVAEGRDVSTTLAQSQDAAAQLSSTLRGRGVEDADLRTLGVNVDTRWDQGAQPSGYAATHRLAVTWRRPDEVTALLQEASAAIGNAFRLESLTLAVSDTAVLEQAARRNAFESARTQATELAALAGRTLGAVETISTDSGFDGGPSPKMRFDAMAAGSAVEGGSYQVDSTVRVRWSLS